MNFSAGMASVVSQLNAALGTNLQFSNPSGTVLQVLNNGAGNVVNSLSATSTVTSLQSGSPQLPLFTDGGQPITGAITAGGSQTTGLAGAIAVNPALVASPSDLVAYAANTASADPTRPNFLLNQMTNAVLTYSPATGLGTSATPYSGTLSQYMSEFVSQQSQAANAATNLQQGQDTVLTALQQRFNDQSGVNIDTEMSNLIALQNAYSANARVMSTIAADDVDVDAGGIVMSITGPGSITAASVAAQTNMMNQLNTLGQELASGQAAQTYSDLQSQAGVTLALNAQLSAIAGYSNTATTVGTTLSVAQSVLTQLGSAGSSIVQAISQQGSFQLNNNGQTITQGAAAAQLDNILSLLNTQVGSNYIFSGSGPNQPSVASASDILNGNGAQAGLTQVISERQQADLGVSGLGHLSAAVGGVGSSTVTLSQDGTPFGFQLTGVNSSLTGAAVTGPSGSPPSISVALASNPNPATRSNSSSRFRTARPKPFRCRRRRVRRRARTSSPSARCPRTRRPICKRP